MQSYQMHIHESFYTLGGRKLNHVEIMEIATRDYPEAQNVRLIEGSYCAIISFEMLDDNYQKGKVNE